MTSSLNDTQTELTSDPLARNTNTDEFSINERCEKEIERLRIQLMRINSYSSIVNCKKQNFDPSFSQWRLSTKLANENERLQEFFIQLEQEFTRVDSLTSEANTIANELQYHIIYNVILRIPVSYFKPNERTIDNLCEPAIQVKRGNGPPHIWDIDKFEYQLTRMRDIHHKWKMSKNKNDLLREELKRNNPFYEEQSSSFVGVANIYLKALFYNSKLDCIVPIVNNQGEISGSLHVALNQIESLSTKKLSDFHINSTRLGSMSDGISADVDEQSLSNHSNSQHSFEDEGIDESSTLFHGINDQITVKFAIKEARDLPPSDAQSVMCRYTFINPKLDQTIVSIKPSDKDNIEQKAHTFSFNHENEYTFPITDRFLSTCLESSISIEVWYQHDSNLQSSDTIENEKDNRRSMRAQELGKQWKDVRRHIEFIVEINELDTSGQWKPVEVDPQEGVLSGGIYRLKQGQSKRLVTRLRVLPRSNALPLSLHAIRSVEIGSISTRKIDAPDQLDSYQDEDLQILRHQWLSSIEKRKLHVESQLDILNQQTNKTANDIQKENILLEELAKLAEEQDIAVFPPLSSGIPGASAAWNPPTIVEFHRPFLFLNLDSFTMSPLNETAGLHATLNEEDTSKMLPLSLIQIASDQPYAVALWNPSIHDSAIMDRVTPNDTIIYLIVKVTVMISKPAPMDIVLRKRIAMTISKTDGSWLGKAWKDFLHEKSSKKTNVVYDVVSHVPKSFHENENLNQLNSGCLSESCFRRYLQYASTIDSVLLLDKLRQEVLLEGTSTKQEIIGKATSAPTKTPQKRTKNIYSSPVNVRRENISHETTLRLNDSEMNSPTPSMRSRLSFIEREQLQDLQTTSSLVIKHQIDLDDDRGQDDTTTLEVKYSIPPTEQTVESSSKTILDSDKKDYIVGSQVIVNTDHSIFNKRGTIRFTGELSRRKGLWYGVELEEALGKNNGSLDGIVYFQCPDKHGVFVRCDKLQLVNST